MTRVLTLIALVVVIATGSAAGGFLWGRSSAKAAYAAQNAKAAAQAQQKVRNAEAKADDAAANYLNDHLDQEARYAQLQEQDRQLARRGVGLIAQQPAVRCAAPAAAASAAAPAQEPAPPTADGADLTRRAVWMWNSALAGRDVPSGACGLAGGAAGAGASAACGEPAGVDVDAAWSNHSVNAQSCAADRARYRALIEVLRARQLVEPEPTAP